MSSDETEEKKDLTRLEDLSEFLHETDPETEALLAKNNQKDNQKKETPPANLDELDDLGETAEKSTPEIETEANDITSDKAISAVEADVSGTEVEEITIKDDVIEELTIEEESPVVEELSAELAKVPDEEENDTTEFQVPKEEITEQEEPPPEDVVIDEEQNQQREYQDSTEDFQTEEIVAKEPSHEISPKENFQDVRDFGESMTFGQVGQGGNPPYSIILRNIQYKEDAEEITRVLKDHGLLSESTQKEIEQGLVNGSLLLSQLSEYSAIFLAHTFRRFDLTLEMGLSAELHHSKSYKDENFRGLVSKQSLYQNVDTSIDLVGGPVTLEQIILSTLSNLENYSIHRYLDVASESVLVDELTFHASNKDTQAKKSRSKKNRVDIFDLDFASPSLTEIYQELAQKLRLKAKELKGNAVVGINYQITPITTHLASARGGDDGLTNAYRITCTGNVVWLSHLQPPI